MTITLTLAPELEAALVEHAFRRGKTPEALADEVLRDRLLGPPPLDPPRDDWERRLRALATDCGVVPPPGAFSREELYD